MSAALDPRDGRPRPAVSVLMAIHNGARYLPATIESLEAQTLSSWELVAVLDRCTDASQAVLEATRDPRIKVVEGTGRRGLAACLNHGVPECRAPLVARLDADDLCAPDRLARQTAAFKDRPGLGVLGAAATLIDGRARPLGIRRVVAGARRVERRLLWRNSLIHPSVMIRRGVLERLGGYDERAVRVEDYELWLRVVGRTEIDNLPEPLVLYRIHSGQATRGTTLSWIDLSIVRQARRGAIRRLGLSGSAAIAMDAFWLAGQLRHEVRRRFDGGRATDGPG